MFPYDINKAIPEVVHRYFAAALGLFAIFLVYLSFLKILKIGQLELAIFFYFLYAAKAYLGT